MKKIIIWLAILLPMLAKSQTYVNGAIQLGSNDSLRYLQGINIRPILSRAQSDSRYAFKGSVPIQYWLRSGTSLSPLNSGDNVGLSYNSKFFWNSPSDTYLRGTNGHIYFQPDGLTTEMAELSSSGLNITGAGIFTGYVSQNVINSLIKANGTGQLIAATSADLPGGPYLPLTGGTLTGALTGTTSTFSGSVTAPNFVSNGGSGQSYLELATVPAPSAPASGTRLFGSGTANRMGFIGTNGFPVQFSSDMVTATRIVRIPNAAGINYLATNPMSAVGDIMYSNNATGDGSNVARLPIGSTGQVLSISGGLPTWATLGTSAYSSTTDFWTATGNQTGLTGTKTGSYNISTSGNIDNSSGGNVKSLYYLGPGAIPATGGVVRLENSSAVSWRNQANTSNATISYDTDFSFIGGGLNVTSARTSTISSAASIFGGTITATQGLFNDGSGGLTIKGEGGGGTSGAIYRYGITPSGTNHSFLAGSSSTIVNAPTSVSLTVGASTKISTNANYTQLFNGLVLPYTTAGSNYSVLVTDYTVNCTSGTFNVTLPSATIGQQFVVKNSGAGVITVVATIDGVTNDVLVAGAAGSYTYVGGGSYIKM